VLTIAPSAHMIPSFASGPAAPMPSMTNFAGAPATLVPSVEPSTNQNKYDVRGSIVNYYVFNPFRGRIILDWNKKAKFGKEDGRESLKSVYDKNKKEGKPPKVIINAGFFDNDECANKDFRYYIDKCNDKCDKKNIGGKNLSVGWTYSDSKSDCDKDSNCYGDLLGAYKNSTWLFGLECKGDLGNYQTLFYYKNYKSEIIQSCKITRSEFEEKAKSAIFVITGNDHIHGGMGRARTVIGVKDDGTIILWTIDETKKCGGGGINSYNAKEKVIEKLKEMGDKRSDYEIEKSILNLDGGGSTQFLHNGEKLTQERIDNDNNRKVGSRFLIFED
jgi:hypothetical protein